MINATKELLNAFFSNNLQYEIPFFQRSYVWKKENWEILWEHITSIAEKEENGARYEHFIGTLITKQQQRNNIGENKLDLIDGQQRLTTIALLFKAIANKASGLPPYARLKDKVNDLLMFENSRGEKFYRIMHSRQDRIYFQAIMDGIDLEQASMKSHRIVDAYQFFLQKLEGYSDERLDILYTTILNNVPVISMLLAQDDDEQEIFDTINSLGVRLTTGELLKNYIFSDETIRPLYERFWQSTFEGDEEDIDFWNEEKTAGRIRRTNIEVLLYCFLIIQTKKIIEIEKLFKQYKLWLKDRTQEDKREMLASLREYALIYSRFPSGRELDELSFFEHEKRFFYIIDHLDITTVYPLILYIYQHVSDATLRLEILKVLESYLVRRNVCRLTTKNYNNLFLQIILKLEDQECITADSFQSILNEFTDDTNRYPSNEEFRLAFAEEELSNANAKPILFCLALHHMSDPKNDIHKLNSSRYTVEHMMPQKWEAHWKKSDATEKDKAVRNKKIKTLGNLTLVTGRMNSSMKNAAWKTKKSLLKEHSHLRITSDYLELEAWDEVSISTRANDLSRVAMQIW